MHTWPYNLNRTLEQAEDRHRVERGQIESRLIKRKEQFDIKVAALEEHLTEVNGFGDLFQYKNVIERIREFHGIISEYSDELERIMTEEMMLFGFKSQFDLFAKVKKGFMPHYELWSTGFEFLTRKREWNATSLSDINATAVDMLIKQSIRALSRLQK